MSGVVYIVHAVDTEGPLYEGLDGLFSEIKEHFDISLEPTQINVDLLREKKIDLGGKEDLAAYFVRPDRVEGIMKHGTRSTKCIPLLWMQNGELD